MTLTNKQRHLLVTLVEECGEIAQHTCKALRFGLDDRDPTIEYSPTERDNISKEILDLLAVVEMLQVDHVLPVSSSVAERAAIEAKKIKVERYMDYARERGEL